MKRYLGLLLLPLVCSAQIFIPDETEQIFKEYYEDRPPLRRTQPVPITPPKQTPPEPLKQSTPPQEPLHRFTLFGVPVNYGIGIRLGRVDQRRKVRVESNDSGVEIKRKDTGEVIGQADGTTHQYTEKNTYDRTELQLVIEHLHSDQRYTRIHFHTSDRINELALITGRSFDTGFWLRPYVELMGLIGYNDAKDLLPTDYGLGLEVGVLYDLTAQLALEAGVGYKVRRWRPVGKNYGQEYWDDTDIQSQVGLRYIF